MGKVRYKDISEKYEKIAAPADPGKIRKGLGFENKVHEYYFLDIDDLIPYKKQARRIFDQKELESLAASINEVGLTSPLLVKKVDDETNKYEVINGERRLRAAKLAGLTKVPCIIADSDNNSELVSIIDNIQRADLHPIELANAYASILSNYTYGDMSVLAEKIGISQSHLSETLKLNDLPHEIKQHLLNNNVKSRSILRQLRQIKDPVKMKEILGLKLISKKQELTRKRNLVNFYIKEGRIGAEITTLKLTDIQKDALKKELQKILDSLSIKPKRSQV